MKYTIPAGTIATAIALWAIFTSVYGLPTSGGLSTPDIVERATGNNNIESVKAVSAKEVRLTTTWAYTCPGEAQATRPFTFDIGLTNNEFTFLGVSNVNSLFNSASVIRDDGVIIDGFVGFRNAICIGAGITGGNACRYDYTGYIWARWHRATGIGLRGSTGTPRGYPSFSITRVCQDATNQGADWCPDAVANVVQCNFQTYTFSSSQT